MHSVLKSMEVSEMVDENMLITDSNELEQLYGAVTKPSLTKVTDHIHPAYRPFIEASTFVALSTSGPDGLDVSPRGDPAGFIYIEDAKTLLFPRQTFYWLYCGHLFALGIISVFLRSGVI